MNGPLSLNRSPCNASMVEGSVGRREQVHVGSCLGFSSPQSLTHERRTSHEGTKISALGLLCVRSRRAEEECWILPWFEVRTGVGACFPVTSSETAWLIIPLSKNKNSPYRVALAYALRAPFVNIDRACLRHRLGGVDIDAGTRLGE